MSAFFAKFLITPILSWTFDPPKITINGLSGLFKNYLKDAKEVLWNGPLGVYEFSKYKEATDEIMQFLVDNNIKTILGGGDIVAAATSNKLKDKIYHVSTGGGATLEYLEGKKLPGLEN